MQRYVEGGDKDAKRVALALSSSVFDLRRAG